MDRTLIVKAMLQKCYARRHIMGMTSVSTIPPATDISITTNNSVTDGLNVASLGATQKMLNDLDQVC